MFETRSDVSVGVEAYLRPVIARSRRISNYKYPTRTSEAFIYVVTSPMMIHSTPDGWLWNYFPGPWLCKS
jgi:hypothetical protein